MKICFMVPSNSNGDSAGEVVKYKCNNIWLIFIITVSIFHYRLFFVIPLIATATASEEASVSAVIFSQLRSPVRSGTEEFLKRSLTHWCGHIDLGFYNSNSNISSMEKTVPIPSTPTGRVMWSIWSNNHNVISRSNNVCCPMRILDVCC